jgi:hypothetical protein
MPSVPLVREHACFPVQGNQHRGLRHAPAPSVPEQVLFCVALGPVLQLFVNILRTDNGLLT